MTGCQGFRNGVGNEREVREENCRDTTAQYRKMRCLSFAKCSSLEKKVGKAHSISIYILLELHVNL